MANYNGQLQDSSSNVLLPTPHSYANVEGSKASQAYAKGDMLVYNNRLCKVTAAIAANNNLTIGTNIAYKNVGEIGKELVASDGKEFYFDVKDGQYGYYPSASKTASEFVPFGGSAPSTLQIRLLVTVGNSYNVNSASDSIYTFPKSLYSDYKKVSWTVVSVSGVTNYLQYQYTSTYSGLGSWAGNLGNPQTLTWDNDFLILRFYVDLAKGYSGNMTIDLTFSKS